MGLGGGAWGAAIPWLACLATVLLLSVDAWAWVVSMLVLGPDLVAEWAFACCAFVESALRFLGCAL